MVVLHGTSMVGGRSWCSMWYDKSRLPLLQVRQDVGESVLEDLDIHQVGAQMLRESEGQFLICLPCSWEVQAKAKSSPEEFRAIESHATATASIA